jgi:excisionase family DNA binding protein
VSRLAIELPDHFVALVADEVLKRLADGAQEPEGWVGVAEAAEHLACPKSRVYSLVSAGRIPHERDGSRLPFKRSDLDEWVRWGVPGARERPSARCPPVAHRPIPGTDTGPNRRGSSAVAAAPRCPSCSAGSGGDVRTRRW